MNKGRSIRAYGLATILVVALAVPCFAATQDEMIEVQTEREETVSSLYTIQERIQAVKEKKGETEAYLRELETQLTELTNELEQLQQAYREKRAELDIITEELMAAEADEAVQHKNMALRIQYMYENSMDNGLLSAVFSAETFNEMLTRMNNMQELSDYDRGMLEGYIAICEQIKAKRADAEAEQEKILALEEECQIKRDEIRELYESTLGDLEEMEAELEVGQETEAQLLASIHAQEAQLSVLFVRAADEVAAAEAAAAQYSAAQPVYTDEQVVYTEEQPVDAGTAEMPAADAPAAEAPAAEAPAPAPETPASPSEQRGYVNNSTWEGPVLTASAGVNQGPNGRETYYNLNMSGVVDIMRNMGNTDEYWVRDDGVKMLGDYVMVAANLDTHPRGSIVESSLGEAIVVDTGGFAYSDPTQLDIATQW